MSDPSQKSSKRPLWVMGIYILIAFVVAAGILAYFVPEHNRASSPAERTAAKN
jgi:flagellar basal body-associated protein FliL